MLSPIKVIDLPNIRRLEDILLLHPPVKGVFEPGAEEVIDAISRNTFGVTKREVEQAHPEEYWDYDDGSMELESPLETADMSDEEATKFLLDLGLDFRDDRNFPLRCTKYLALQAEVAAKGMMGKMPDRSSVGLQAWAENLEKEADAFKRRRK